jgi:hypothetical protein
VQGALEHGDILAGENSPQTTQIYTTNDYTTSSPSATQRLTQQKSFAAQV